MPEEIKESINRLREDITKLESYDSSYWSKSLGTTHLKTLARVIKNDADSLAAHLINY